MPLPKYNSAQRHLQFSNYYGYQPSQVPMSPTRPKSMMAAHWQQMERRAMSPDAGGDDGEPRSLPSDLNEPSAATGAIRRKSGKEQG